MRPILIIGLLLSILVILRLVSRRPSPISRRPGSRIEPTSSIIDSGIPQPVSYRRNRCGYRMNKTLADVLKKHRIGSHDTDYQLQFPCRYDQTSDEINQMVGDQTAVFIIDSGDQISNKHSLWENLVSYHGFEAATQMMPETYLLHKPADLKRLKAEFDDPAASRLFIMKKNIQRQEGLRIIDRWEQTQKVRRHGFVLVQKLLQNPYTIEGRKINLRFYILVVCRNRRVESYIHDRGFVYYTQAAFRPGTRDWEANITTGYLKDRSVYARLPLTHADLRTYLDSDRPLTRPEDEVRTSGRLISDVVYARIADRFRQAIEAVSPVICRGRLDSQLTFQLYGGDAAVADDLSIQLMELNKGPDMGAKDDRDYALKFSVLEDVFRLIGAIEEGEHRFSRLL